MKKFICLISLLFVLGNIDCFAQDEIEPYCYIDGDPENGFDPAYDLDPNCHPEEMPLDSGIGLLIGTSVLYGVSKLRKKSNGNDDQI